MLRFKYAGRREEEDLDLGARLLRETGPAIEDDLTREVGWTKVERGRLGKSLRVSVSPHEGAVDAPRAARRRIGKTILDNLMALALHNPTAPLITASGQLASGGRMSGDRIGL